MSVNIRPSPKRSSQPQVKGPLFCHRSSGGDPKEALDKALFAQMQVLAKRKNEAIKVTICLYLSAILDTPVPIQILRLSNIWPIQPLMADCLGTPGTAGVVSLMLILPTGSLKYSYS